MDREAFLAKNCGLSFPHTRGDGPGSSAAHAHASAFSPHPWGWTSSRMLGTNCGWVFPTPVGMDRGGPQPDQISGRFPHTRGDGPKPADTEYQREKFSPHPWGWTDTVFFASDRVSVFPTPVGMDRLPRPSRPAAPRFPHTRGDGPCADDPGRRGVVFSPHPWGWTGQGDYLAVTASVFPTPVGMDRILE